tara:strand:+ start:785 stop:1504 length:720 start_codon:yes stop_codon:yes gene_type:complete
LVSAVIKNWDNKNWLSSSQYISSLNNFIIKTANLNSNSQILDIGCGRGKIIGSLRSVLRLRYKPIGIDLVNHDDKDKRIIFKKKDALSFLKLNKKKFDLILIKQTIHLLKIDEIKALLKETKKNLKPQGKILIFSLHPHKNELPCFYLMKKKLRISLKRDLKIQKIIFNLYPRLDLKYFSFKVKISKKKYIQMISKKFISILLSLNNKQILTGINEIDLKYKKNLKFYDKLVCIIIKNN